MDQPAIHPLTMDGRDPAALRGDPISGDRYTSREFMQQEWDHLWTRIWHVAGRTAELEEPGDYVVHDFRHESVICIRQDDGSIKAFYNACGHRGMRLTEGSAFAEAFTCPYHGWKWGKDGVLHYAQDPHDFPQGNPCGKLKLKELRCATWGGFVWYTMDDAAPALLDYLAPMPELYKNYPMDTGVRVFWMKINLNTNWKFATDNFSESYHTRTAHPQVPPWIDQDVDTARHEMYPAGHGRTVQPMRPSLSDRLPDGVPHPFDHILRQWDIDPDSYPDYETKAMQGWLDLKAAKRRLWRERGYVHYEHMDDEQITDSPHTVIFPNVTISFLPDNILFFRTEPHADDPGKCTFDLWCMAFPVAGQAEVESIMAGPQPFSEADMLWRDFDNGRGVPEIEGQIVYQDMMLAEGMQRGMHSRGYGDAYLSAQETRVRYFHEVLNDYLAGRR
ncbi:phenylpropionate dioxygenase-like ring-hydroxylating dioxygenase large terminal subunit [Sphingobium xenophagum]|uniref:Phenylpropionate dioxygenase-like ring-hydroxylating dioxygenase large terminal subunit n=1 Tax=Sphingobium xenophagum TaxID=121428 RepID=A0ABU1X062_SPHXE|nr:aromatic ring-hydroxylating dioxygenase subunit alpha [Sphingobium xenophagum]MDR7154953.1 phenylpropionate dioxygenase-like ring-hydroxylating dioxygenase large terminal subunit [Sphingobium xenophagum]